MMSDERAEVLHVDLRACPSPLMSARPLYWLVFWWGDRAVGQCELRASDGECIDLEALAGRVVAADALAEAREAEAAERDASPRIGRTSVVICTRDRADALRRCLASLPLQSRPPDEIIVVDNASVDDRTRQVAAAAGVTYVREDRPGLDIARNTGALAASGEFIFYTDDDVVLHPRWLERMLAAFDADIDAVTGLVLPGELETPAQLHFERFWSFSKGFRRTDFGAEFYASDRVKGCPAWEVGAGASMAFRAAVFDQIGLFDERLDVGASGCSGDSEYWHRLLSHRRCCRYEPSAVAYHFHRRDWTGLRRQLRAYMSGHSSALLVQYERSRNRGNLRRAFWELPRWFIRRSLGSPVPGYSRRFLAEEIIGYVAGLIFYWRSSGVTYQTQSGGHR